MRTVGIKVLKNKLSEYVRLAAGGETVLISDRDRVVAELGPPRPDRAAHVGDAELLELVREGIVSPALDPPGPCPPRPPPVMTLAELMGVLDDVRADR